MVSLSLQLLTFFFVRLAGSDYYTANRPRTRFRDSGADIQALEKLAAFRDKGPCLWLSYPNTVSGTDLWLDKELATVSGNALLNSLKDLVEL